ncbi:MAG: hypothetical protein KGS61_07295 [Verrucomicrobia bacterium]|nr:hypothetical protein [Verrucomicrobiota bacterium]
MESIKDVIAEKGLVRQGIPTVSAVFKDGGILETVHDAEAKKTRFVLWRDGKWEFKDGVNVGPARRLVPYSAYNNLVRNDVVLFPSEPAEYESEQALLDQIVAFIHRYVDVSPLFEQIASYYVLFSWVYDGFNELPYLRVRGDPGSGKTRFLLTVGSLCYKPIFASGASTVSPIFRILEIFKGTLIIDESDFRLSDEKAEVVKILNNGNVKGFPVLRSEVSGKGEYNPRAYHVFGPKIVATRGSFDDRALESRFLTEEMGQHRLRDDVPINLPQSHKAEALALRNKLLMFRFRNFNRRVVADHLVDRTIEPRLNQIFLPLLSIIEDKAAQAALRDVARQYHREMVSERGLDTEAQILEVIQSLIRSQEQEAGPLSLADITSRFTDLYADQYERKITNKWVGGVIRRRLHLRAYRNRDGFVIPATEAPKLERLYERYGLTHQVAGEAAPESPPACDRHPDHAPG